MIILIAQFELRSVHTREVIAIFELRSVHTRDRIWGLAFQSGRRMSGNMYGARIFCASVNDTYILQKYASLWLLYIICSARYTGGSG